jgi:hypothetical protein
MWNITAMEGDLWLQKTKFAEERSPKRRGKVVVRAVSNEISGPAL